MRGNETRNQHFVPQVEQKLNASNPDSTSGKFRIYSFRITDREAYRIELEAPRGRAIASTLSMLDLFSFDVPGGGPLRMNLEALFHKYEANVAIHTKGLLEKLAAGSADIKTELIDLFAGEAAELRPQSLLHPEGVEQLSRRWTVRADRSGAARCLSTDRQRTEAAPDSPVPATRRIAGDLCRVAPADLRSVDADRGWPAEPVRRHDQGACLRRATRRPQPLSGPTTKTSACSRIEATASPFQMARTWRCPSISCATAFVDYIFADAATLVEGRAAPAFVAHALQPPGGSGPRPQSM